MTARLSPRHPLLLRPVALLAILLAAPVHGATVSGVIVHAITGQPVVGAQVRVEGAEASGRSDLHGLVLLDVEPGTWTAVAEKDGFESARVLDIQVGAAGGDFALVLEPAGGGGATGKVVSEAITVEAEADTASEAALLAERKNAAQISDAIGAEEMSKTTGGDAAGVLKRVTGLSLQDDKFVYVRGLGDRYSNTALNGSQIPSTEFEKKVVPLNLFPKDLIQKITVSKSYTVDKPGNFVAGLVELSTVEFPVRQTGSIGLSVGTNSATTGDPYLRYPGGLDFFGGGGQSIPSSVPDEDLVRFSPFTQMGFPAAELESIGESIGGDWGFERDDSAPFDLGFDLSYGNSSDRIGYSLSATYESDVSTLEDEQRNFYITDSSGDALLNTNYTFDTSTEKVRQALTGNVAFKASDTSQVRLSGLFTNLSSAEGRFQEGFFSDIDSIIEDTTIQFREQDITNLQLSGDHFFSGLGDGGLLEWRLSSSEAETAENRRETLYERLQNGDFILTDNASSGFLYFNDLTDEVGDVRVDWSSMFSTASTYGSVKFGLAYTESERQFDGRRIRFFHRNTFGIDLTQTPEELFSEEFIRPNGFEIQEITRATDSYLGEQSIPAAYVQGDVAFGKFRIIGGVRFEDSEMDVVTFDRNNPLNPPIVTELDNQDVLPALSLVFKAGPASNLRFSASRTVNRPEYRELAPFQFTNVVGGYAQQGNPDLQQATVTSLDARWEWFPSGREVIAASVFYKDFEDPIEQILLAGAEELQTYQNAVGAENLGAEIEVRRNLGSWVGALEPLTMILNLASIDSEIELPEDNPLTNQSRSLVGQPETVGNFILEWNAPKAGTLLRLLYNHTGEKVDTAGAFGLDDIVEDERGVLDFVWVQGLEGWIPGLKFKLSASNLTDEDVSWSQQGQVWRLYEPGTSVGLSFSFEPFSR